MKKNNLSFGNRAKLVLLPLIIGILGGCTTLWTGQDAGKTVSSSLVDYLYPGGQVPSAEDAAVKVHLKVPLSVGIAFVPGGSSYEPGLSEMVKGELLNNVKIAFQDRPFIKEIIVIPDTYLRSGKGFDAIEGVARLYGLDVIAMVSYDQVAHADDRGRSFLYLTIIGAYMVKGSKQDVQTFVDTAVLDIPTRKLLFRAAGGNTLQDTSTLIKSSEKIRNARQESFKLAMAEMTANLDKELIAFSDRIKAERNQPDARVAVTYAKDYKGGGSGSASFDFWSVALLLPLILIVLAGRRTRQ